MNRRAFLTRLATFTAAGVVGVELDLDKLLWVPGAKTYVFGPGYCHDVCRPPFVPGDGTMFNPVHNVAGMYLIGKIGDQAGYDWFQDPKYLWRFTEAQISAAAKGLADAIDRRGLELFSAVAKTPEIAGGVDWIMGDCF